MLIRNESIHYLMQFHVNESLCMSSISLFPIILNNSERSQFTQTRRVSRAMPEMFQILRNAAGNLLFSTQKL